MMMNRVARRILAGTCLMLAAHAQAQCTNGSLYPGAPVVPNASGLVTQITDCSYQTEYSWITSIVEGNPYEFTIADGSYITVHQGSNAGPVLAYGYSPVTALATTDQDLYPTWNVNESCGTAGNCLVTTVQRLLGCQAPEVSITIENDCEAGVFLVDLLLSTFGDAVDLDLVYTVDNGVPTTMDLPSIGSYQIGPFTGGSLIDIIVEHDVSALCDVQFFDVTNPVCPIISCGPDTYTHCYGNSEDFVETYQGDSNYPLQLIFQSGNVSPSGNDALVIRDGLNVTDPILFWGVGNGGNLTGVTVISTNPDHALTLTMTSNSSYSCADGGVSPPWTYIVGCLDCTSPEASFEVVPDCLHHSYMVGVEVTDLGSSSDVRITDSWSNDTISGIGLGVTPIGPVPVGVPVVVTVLNGDNPFCRVNSPDLYFPADSCINISCAAQAVEYCYADADTAWFIYQSDAGVPITMSFTGGQLLADDILMLYNGKDASAQLVYAGDANGSPAGLTLTSNNADHALTLRVASNADGSCADGGADTPLAWVVSCGLSGIADTGDESLRIRLDPILGELWLDPGHAFDGLVRIEVFDALGRMVWDEQRAAAQLGFSPLRVGNLVTGRYSLRISSSTRTLSAGFALVK